MLITTNKDNTLTLRPEMPYGWNGDMEWDLSDVAFILEMENVENLCHYIGLICFQFQGETYEIDEHDVRELSCGKFVEVAPCM